MIYTDKVIMVSDGKDGKTPTDELHQFAEKMGMNKNFFSNVDFPQYRLYSVWSKKAIIAGARLTKGREMLEVIGL